MIKNIIKVLFSNAVLAIIGIINSIFLPLFLSVEGYAYYQKYILFLSYINICHLGIASGMFLEYAGKKYQDTEKKQYKSEINLILIVLSFFSIMGLIIWQLTDERMFLFVALSIYPNCLIASFQALYQAWERFTLYSIMNLLPKLLFTIIVLIGITLFGNISGQNVVIVYIVIIWIISLYSIFEFAHFTKGVKSARIISKRNFIITKEGFLITLGNYVNLLFHSIDKQFVELFYNTVSFACYSFAMSLQNIMVLFITALSSPFYPRLAKGDIDKKYIDRFKTILFVFGTYSGCAYFVISFIIKNFIAKYESSLIIVAIFFVVVPAMAVINVIYGNLYKIKKMLKKYLLTLLIVLVVAVILNGVVVTIGLNYKWIAFTTMLTYYIWLFYSQHDFDEISLYFKDYIFLIGFFLFYFLSINIKNDLQGFLIYTLTISLWNLIFYKSSVLYVISKILKKKDGLI